MKKHKTMKITIIGGGNIGGAIASGLSRSTKVGAENITVVDISDNTLTRIREANPEIGTTKNGATAVRGADIVIISVKPWLVEEIIGSLKSSLDYSRQTIISIAAGITFSQLRTFLRKDETRSPALFRVIPNTAISLSQSMTFISSYGASAETVTTVREIFEELGRVALIDESLMVSGTAVGSCGTAFALQYMRASMEGGVELGLEPDAAREAVIQTIKGAIALLEEFGTLPQTEIDKVTTPGGITIKGLGAMEEAGFTSAVIRGLKACK